MKYSLRKWLKWIMYVYNETLSKIMFIFVADADELQKDENLGKTTGT